MVTEEEEDMMEDCLENCPPQVLAASSKAAAADILEILRLHVHDGLHLSAEQERHVG